VSFDQSGEAELVRAIALDVTLDDPNVVIGAVDCVNADYGIYPGSISIDAGGNVTDWGNCDGAGLDTNTVATEQGSLYVGAANAPAQSGDLFIITLDGCTADGSGDVVVSITEDELRGGVVLEDPDLDPTVVLPADVTVTGLPNCDEGCPCYGDYTGPLGVPDGQVSTSDMGALLGLLGAAGAPYVVDPMPAGWECMDLTGPVGVPDGVLSTSDMGALLGYLGTIGAPYVGPCMPAP
jgi:hypothetical protein